MAANGTSAIRVSIHGRVQGVWYRGWTVENAAALGLSGWVRNRGDGTVEALFAGSSDAVETMIARCHDGPPAAHVIAVERFPATTPAEPGFNQLPTV